MPSIYWHSRERFTLSRIKKQLFNDELKYECLQWEHRAIEQPIEIGSIKIGTQTQIKTTDS